MNENLRNRILVLGLGLGLLTGAAFASQPQAVLGSSGELYVVRNGAYGDLFPSGRATEKTNPVLALEVTWPDKAPVRTLIPATANLDIESSPSLVYEDDSERLFVLWESRTTNSILKLASYDGSRWTDAFSVTGNPFSQKSSPQLAVTRDEFRIKSTVSSDVVVRHRTVLHIIWVEEQRSNETIETFYTPVILENGSYVGKSQVYRLSEYDTSRAVPGSIQPSPDLMRSPAILSGRDDRSVVVGFVSTSSRQLVTLEVDVLPEELGQIAEVTRATIIDTGVTLTKPGSRGTLANQAAKSIFDHGDAFHTEFLQALADRVRGLILDEGGSDDLVSLGETTRATIIDTGARLSGRGLRSPRPSAEKIVEARPEADASSNAIISTSYHMIRFREVSSRFAPPVDAGSFTLVLSKSGEDMLVVWPIADRVLYYSSQGEDDWSDRRELKLTNGMTLEKAYEVLSRRVR